MVVGKPFLCVSGAVIKLTIVDLWYDTVKSTFIDVDTCTCFSCQCILKVSFLNRCWFSLQITSSLPSWEAKVRVRVPERKGWIQIQLMAAFTSSCNYTVTCQDGYKCHLFVMSVFLSSLLPAPCMEGFWMQKFWNMPQFSIIP